MNKPTWVNIIGVLGIIFSCFGIMGGMQDIALPKMLEMQKSMFTAFAQQAEKSHPKVVAPNESDTTIQPPQTQQEFFNNFGKVWDFPAWFSSWCIFVGIAKIITSAIYLFASISLLQLKPFAIRLFYWSSGANITLAVVKACVALSAFSFFGMIMMFGGFFGAIVDIVFVIVVATSDKAAFQPPQKKFSLDIDENNSPA